MAIPKWLLRIMIFGCVGITTEIFFTAGWDFVQSIQTGSSPDLKLQGKSYVWMFPIYGSAGILLPIFMPLLERFHMALRLLIFLFGIYSIEFITGWLIEAITGKCPWEYFSIWSIPGWGNEHISGYINMSFAPFWLFFAFMLMLIYRWTEGVIKTDKNLGKGIEK